MRGKRRSVRDKGDLYQVEPSRRRGNARRREVDGEVGMVGLAHLRAEGRAGHDRVGVERFAARRAAAVLTPRVVPAGHDVKVLAARRDQRGGCALASEHPDLVASGETRRHGERVRGRRAGRAERDRTDRLGRRGVRESLGVQRGDLAGGRTGDGAVNLGAAVLAALEDHEDITRHRRDAGRGCDGDRRRGRLSRDYAGQLGGDCRASGQGGHQGGPAPCSEHAFLTFCPRQRAGVGVLVIHHSQVPPQVLCQRTRVLVTWEEDVADTPAVYPNSDNLAIVRRSVWSRAFLACTAHPQLRRAFRQHARPAGAAGGRPVAERFLGPVYAASWA